MRVRNLCVGVAAVAALSVPVVATAATPQQVFTGTLESSDDATVKVKTGATNGYRVKAFGARAFAISCGDADGTIKRAAIKGRIPIGGRGRFHARDDNGDTVLNVNGEIDGRKASGVFRFSGEIEDQDGESQDCDSGRLDWEAKLTKGPDIGP
jgi:hypothetical protein